MEPARDTVDMERPLVEHIMLPSMATIALNPSASQVHKSFGHHNSASNGKPISVQSTQCHLHCSVRQSTLLFGFEQRILVRIICRTHRTLEPLQAFSDMHILKY